MGQNEKTGSMARMLPQEMVEKLKANGSNEKMTPEEMSEWLKANGVDANMSLEELQKAFKAGGADEKMSPEELYESFMASGKKLSDDQLEMVAGGYGGGKDGREAKCPHCGSTKIIVASNGAALCANCKKMI